MMWTYVMAWLPMVAIAIVNGLLRDLVYGRRMSERRAHQMSTLLAMVLFGIYIREVVELWPPTSSGQAAQVGLVWLLLTVAFEFGFGHCVAGLPWKRLLQDYNVASGRVWPALLVWVAFAPYLFYLGRSQGG